MESQGKIGPLSRNALWVGLFASIGMALGPLLPWGIAGRPPTSGIELTHGEAVLLIIAGIVLVVRFIVAIARDEYVSRAWTIWIGASSLGYNAYLYGCVLNSVDRGTDTARAPSVGFGLTLSMTACFVVLATSARLGRRADQDSNKSAPASA